LAKTVFVFAIRMISPCKQPADMCSSFSTNPANRAGRPRKKDLPNLE
jgi:hypothetical protein